MQVLPMQINTQIKDEKEGHHYYEKKILFTVEKA